MSALWITGYLTTVVLGASLAIVGFLPVELWLQNRRIRSRHQHRKMRLAVGSAPESVLAMEESAEAKSPAGRALAKLSPVSGSRSNPSTTQFQVKPDTGSQPVTASAKVGGGASSVRKNGDEKAAAPPKTTAAPVRQSSPIPSGPSSSATGAKSAEPRKNQIEGREKKAVTRQANGGKGQKPASPVQETHEVVPGLTLDELYDREVPTVIASELVDEDEPEQELSPDDMIEAEVL